LVPTSAPGVAPPLGVGVEHVSVDQVGANLCAIVSWLIDRRERVCPSIRLVPTSAPLKSRKRRHARKVSVDQVGANLCAVTISAPEVS